jgi:enoyl-CoA hydratase
MPGIARDIEHPAFPPYPGTTPPWLGLEKANKAMNLTSGLIGAETTGPIGWLIWDNPTKLNALSPGMYEDALSVIEAYEADPAIKVVIMRGAGRKAFISGADITSFNKTRADAETTRRAREAPEKLSRKLQHLDMPLIAMIYGYCLGGGLGMALNADLRFASSDAQFSVPAAVRGIAYAPAGLKSLVDLVGPSVAKDIMFSARRLKADEALRVGLINRVVEAEELEANTIAYAETLAANAPLSVRASKYFINQLGLERAQRDEARMDAMQREAEGSEDFKEATRSFAEKRKPVFQGR